MVNIIPNQTVKLYKSEDFNSRNKRLTWDYRQYCQLVKQEQSTMFQVQVTPDADNIIIDGDFTGDFGPPPGSWNVERGLWVISYGRLGGIITPPGVYAGVYQVVNGIEQNRTYQVSARAQFNSDNDSATLYIIVNDPSLNYVVAKSYSRGEVGLAEFDVTLYWRSYNATQAYVSFYIFGNLYNDAIFIDDVQMLRLSEPVVTLEDCDGNYISDVQVYDRGNDRINYIINWTGLPDGCYRVCVAGVDDTLYNYLDIALALGTNGGSPLLLGQGGYIKWFG